MQPNKQRQIVDDLGVPAPLQPIAQGNEFYVRPDVVTIGAPPPTNPLLQLGQALANVNPALNRYLSVAPQIDAEAEYARAATEFYGPNRNKWIEATRSGKIPEGANPYFVRAIQRLDLKTQALPFSEYLMKSYQDGYGSAKDSDDPAVLMGAMNKLQDTFIKDVRSRGRYNALDLNEILYPEVQKAERALHTYHANYRIQEHERIGEQTVGMATGQIITNGYTDHRDPEALKNIGVEINTMLRDNLSGVVPNGMSAKRANEVVIDRVIADAVAAGDQNMAGAVLRHITTNDGKNNLAETPYAKSKLETARHSIIQWKHTMDVNNEWNRDKDHRARVVQYSDDTMKWAYAEHDRKVQSNDREDKVRAKLSFGMSLIAMPSPDGHTERDFEKVAKELGQLDAKEEAWLRGFAHTLKKQRIEHIDTPETNRQAARLRLDMMRDPMAFDERRLASALAGDVIGRPEFFHQMDELTKERRAGDTPLLSSPSFTAMGHFVEKAVIGKRDLEFDPKVIPDVLQARTEFRALAREWIEKNPQGGPGAFEVYMTGKGRDIIERFEAKREDVGTPAAQKELAKQPKPAAPKQEKRGLFDFHDPEAVPHPPIKVPGPRPPLEPKTVQALVTKEAQADIMATFGRFSAPKPGEEPATERDVQQAIIKAYAPVYAKDGRDATEMMKMVDATLAHLKKTIKKAPKKEK